MIFCAVAIEMYKIHEAGMILVKRSSDAPFKTEYCEPMRLLLSIPEDIHTYAKNHEADDGMSLMNVFRFLRVQTHLIPVGRIVSTTVSTLPRKRMHTIKHRH